MDDLGEQPRFEVKQIVEQKPFIRPSYVNFMKKQWFPINDSLALEVVNRADWEQRGVKDILEKRPDDKQTLYIPKDLQLWEMIGIMEVVDRDTFANKPERRDEAKKKLRELGKIFENAGIYIAQRLSTIDQGKDIARVLAEELYGYGQSLTSGEFEKKQTIDAIASHDLTPSEIDAVDRFLAGDTLYQSRQAGTEKKSAGDPLQKEKLYETERQKTLAQFFKVSEKAFELERKNESGELQVNTNHLKPWQSDTPFHHAFIVKIKKAMKQKIETPKREFETAIFRRGLEKLVSEMKERGWRHSVNSLFEKLGIDLRIEQRKLSDALNIGRLKAELESVRKTADTTKISTQERKIANIIQKAVSNFPFQSRANNPSEIVKNQYINCVGASILGGILMREAGLNYLVGDMPNHSILFLVTNDNHVERRDMLKLLSNVELTDEMITGTKNDGSPMTVSDIIVFSQKPYPEGLMFDIKNEKYRDKLDRLQRRQKQFLAVFSPEYGQQIQVLSNIGNALFSLGYYEESIEAYRQTVIAYTKYPYVYYNLGGNFFNLRYYKEAIKAHQQAIAINPHFVHSYNGLGNALSSLGRKEEAIEAYQKFIDLADIQKEERWIKRAEKIIAELKNK
ncbi:MAG TPA: tetratricopeptide repeat protein [Patescibacteria group bacterium]|nr:tetratricopeptide repeat protein [Patescibacteria group bacterium]